MNITLAILTMKDGVNLQELTDVLKHEKEVIAQWTEQGYIHDFYLRQTKNGAVILFNENIDEEKAQELISTLPLFPYFKPAEYFGLIK